MVGTDSVLFPVLYGNEQAAECKKKEYAKKISKAKEPAEAFLVR